MENASKALIIAGAILLSILIIGLGMLIFNNARDTISNANLDQETITAFNSKFEEYIGENRKGTQVKNLLALVRDNNSAVIAKGGNATATADEMGLALISADGQTDPGQIATMRSRVVNGRQYTVTATYNPNTGLIATLAFDPTI